MNPSQQEQRHTAAQEFLQSLEQLEGILQQDQDHEGEATPEVDSCESNDQVINDVPDIDLTSFEDAMADIEQYLEDKGLP